MRPSLVTFLTSPRGRLGRRGWWLVTVAAAVVLGVARVIDGQLGSGELLETTFSLAMVWPGLALTIRRLHAQDLAAWRLPLRFVPLIALVVCGFLAGDAGPNRFGPPTR